MGTTQSSSDYLPPHSAGLVVPTGTALALEFLIRYLGTCNLVRVWFLLARLFTLPHPVSTGDARYEPAMELVELLSKCTCGIMYPGFLDNKRTRTRGAWSGVGDRDEAIVDDRFKPYTYTLIVIS